MEAKKLNEIESALEFRRIEGKSVRDRLGRFIGKVDSVLIDPITFSMEGFTTDMTKGMIIFGSVVDSIGEEIKLGARVRLE